MGYVFNSTTPNTNYALNQLNRSHSILDAIVNGINSIVNGLFNGGGAIASNEKVEQAVQWAVNKASNNYITYSQSNRNLKNPDGTSFDCSSFIITAFYAVGVDINASSTSDLKTGFEDAGFTWHAGTYWEASDLRRGDILLSIGIHTQMYIGNNQDVNCGSTPAGVETHSVNNYGRGWSGILRYEQ